METVLEPENWAKTTFLPKNYATLGATPLEPVEPYWMQTVRAVDRVWEDETLREFWRHGELVPNREHRHPYQAAIPEGYEEIQRWYLLETSLDPERPWGQQTNLPVFSIALIRGEPGSRQWLLYAHSPLTDREQVEITVPHYGTVTVDVPRAGAFYLLDEQQAADPLTVGRQREEVD